MRFVRFAFALPFFESICPSHQFFHLISINVDTRGRNDSMPNCKFLLRRTEVHKMEHIHRIDKRIHCYLLQVWYRQAITGCVHCAFWWSGFFTSLTLKCTLSTSTIFWWLIPEGQTHWNLDLGFVDRRRVGVSSVSSTYSSIGRGRFTSSRSKATIQTTVSNDDGWKFRSHFTYEQ